MLRRNTILIVDDEPGVRLGMESVFRKAGWRVRCATTSGEAISLLACEQFDAVVLDNWLRPGKEDGLALLGLVRTLAHVPAVYLLTGYGSRALERRARELGVHGYFEKPLSPNVLLAILERTVGSAPLSDRSGRDRAPCPERTA